MCMPIFGKTCNLLENKKTIIILEMIIKIVTVIIIIIIIIKIIISDVARIYVPRKKGRKRPDKLRELREERREKLELVCVT